MSGWARLGGDYPADCEGPTKRSARFRQTRCRVTSARHWGAGVRKAGRPHGAIRVGKTKVTTFGLDIGSSAVKLVELVPVKTGYTLKSFAMVDLPREAITEGSIRQPAVVTDAIRECVQRAGVRARAR